jgi:hypothetical protein
MSDKCAKCGGWIPGKRDPASKLKLAYCCCAISPASAYELDRQRAAAMLDDSGALGWCEYCGEGVTDFCRRKTMLCPKGLRALKQKR